MIIKKIQRQSRKTGWKAQSANRLLKYLLRDKDGKRVIDHPIVDFLVQGRIFSQDQTAWRQDVVKALTQYVKRVRRRRRTKDYFAHIVLAFSPDDTARLGRDDAGRSLQIEVILRELIPELGFSNRPWIAVMHQDKKHLHVHLLACLYDPTGRAVRISWDAHHYKMLAGVAERAFKLIRSKSEQDILLAAYRRRAPKLQQTTGEIRANRECSTPSVRQNFQNVLDQILVGSKSLNEFAIACVRKKVRVIPYFENNKVLGLSYQMGIDRMRASDLGAKYQWPQLKLEYKVISGSDEEKAVITHWRANLADEWLGPLPAMQNAVEVKFLDNNINFKSKYFVNLIAPLKIVFNGDEICFVWPDGKPAFTIVHLKKAIQQVMPTKIIFNHLSERVLNLVGKVLEECDAKVRRIIGPKRDAIQNILELRSAPIRRQSRNGYVSAKKSQK